MKCTYDLQRISVYYFFTYEMNFNIWFAHMMFLCDTSYAMFTYDSDCISVKCYTHMKFTCDFHVCDVHIWCLYMIYRIWCLYMMFAYDAHMWCSHVTFIVFRYNITHIWWSHVRLCWYIWCLYMMFVYDAHMWCSHMTFVVFQYNITRIWWSHVIFRIWCWYMMFTYDVGIWRSHVNTPQLHMRVSDVMFLILIV